MSNSSSNDRSGQRPAPRSQPPVSLSQLGRGDEPLLIPITPTSSVEEIVQLVRNAGASRVELLVPDGTAALQSIAGNETLREAAKATGTRVTIFTADEKTTDAARFARLDVVSVGGSVAAPRPGTKPRRPTAQQPAVQPSTPPLMPRPPQGAQASPPPPQRTQSSTPQPPRPANDADFLAQLEAFEQSPPAEPPRLRESDEGAVLYDVPGDIGVQRPAQNDDEWQQAFGALDSAAPPEPQVQPPAQTPARRQRRVAGGDRLPQPSLFGALVGNLPRRSRRPPAEEVADDNMLRMARPERSPEELAARRRQSRNLLLWPLLAVVLLLTIGALWFAFNGNLSLGRGPALRIAPPLNTANAQEFTNQIVPLVADPVSDPSSINVQGMLLTAPVTVTLQGTAEKTTLAPIGFASGTITLRNRSTQPVTIPAGTEVTAGSQKFTLQANVTVPARTDTEAGTTFGVAQATLKAITPGGQGNIGPGTITAIPGFSGTITVAQPGAFAGGSDQEVKIVSPDDVNRLLPQALSQLYGKGVKDLVAQVQQQPGFELVKGQATAEITPTQDVLMQIRPDQYAVFPPIGQVTQDGNFTLQVFQTFSALAGPQNKPIDQELQRAVAAKIRQQRPELGNANIEITGWRRGDQGLLVDAIATPRSSYQQVPPTLASEIQDNIKGKSRAAAQEYLDTLKSNGSIGDFTLPENWQTVPDNVQVAIAPPDQAK